MSGPLKPTDTTGKSKWLQGFYTPKHPKKYKGDPSKIFYRSRPELKLMQRFDTDPNIVAWSSEEVIIPYTCRTDGKLHRYIPDFCIVSKRKDGSLKRILIEYKPASQSKPPVQGSKKKKTFINECKVWAKNSSKWDAAQRWCELHGMEFVVLNEKHLGVF
jgi:hypothetical protein